MSNLTAGWGTTKPPPGLPINPGHPLARFCRAAYLLNEGSGWRMRNAAKGGAFPGIPSVAGGDPTISGVTWRRGPRGPITYHDNNGTGDAVSGRIVCTGAAPLQATWSIVGRWWIPSGATADGSLIGSEAIGGIQIRGGAGNTLVLLAQQSANLGASTTPTWVPDAWNDVAVTRLGTGPFRFYINGLDAGGASDATTFTTTAGVDISSASHGELTNGMQTEFVYIFDGIVLTAQQVKQLTDMPYDLIWKPHWIGAFQVAAGGQDTPELYGRPYGQRGQRHMQQVLAQ